MTTGHQASAIESFGTPFQVQPSWSGEGPVIMVRMDAASARKRVSTWLFDHVATMLMGDIPQLMFHHDAMGLRAEWRVPVVLTSKGGIVGRVGEIRVNAETGRPSIDADMPEKLLVSARSLLNTNATERPPSPSAG